MRPFELVAHRGVTDVHPENTISAFERAIDLGADAVELDVRLTSDRVPVVFHYFYLDKLTAAQGTIFDHTFEQVCDFRITGQDRTNTYAIPTLMQVLEAVGGRVGLEIEIKGPEPESAGIIADALSGYKSLWDTIEVTSFESQLLQEFHRRCPDIPIDLLFPPSEPWMKLDVAGYIALHRSRLANARAVHLHPAQLTHAGVENIRKYGIEVHAWDVNDLQSLEICAQMGIPRICTDQFQEAKDFRTNLTTTSQRKS